MKKILILILIFLCHTFASGQIKNSYPLRMDLNKTNLNVNPYSDFRQMAFLVKLKDLQLNSDTDRTFVYGVIMDLDVGKTIASVVAYKTGDASVYFRSGQLFIGGSGHKKIRNAALDLINSAQDYIKNSEITIDNSLPEKGCIKFYLLTNIGTFVHQETTQILTDSKNIWTILFSKGDQIITEYRLISENKK